MSGPDFLFAHFSDAHVGAWPRSARLRAELRECVLRTLRRVEESGAQFLLISGDLFHTPVPDPAEVAPAAAALRRLVDRGIRIYAVYGSHDYVAHRTSWLDVLAEAGVFFRVAPESVRAEGTRWTLPFLVDEPTGARIAGISGRSHGYDREYFRAVDSEAFRAEPGFRIFLFHAAVEEYLPPGPLREHISGIRREDLPAGCDYYAGGHIHFPYEGEGPAGGLLVNPGTLFGTSTTDLGYHGSSGGRQGLAIVSVTRGKPSVEFYDPFRPEAAALEAIDISHKTHEEIRAEVTERARRPREPGSVVVTRLGGILSEGTLSELRLGELVRGLDADGRAVYLDVAGVRESAASQTPPASESEIEAEGFRALAEETAADAPWAQGEEGSRLLAGLLEELGRPKTDGQSREDYRQERVEGSLALLDVPRPSRG